MKRLLELAPYIAPALATVLLGVFGPSIRTAARLRRDLSADAEAVEALPEGVKNAMREDMGRRALILMGYSRYPILTLSDLIAGVGVLLSIGAWGYTCYDYSQRGFDPMTTLFPLGLILALLVTSYLTFHIRWTERSGQRIRYLHEKIGEEQAVESARLARIAWHVSSGFGFIMVIGLTGSLGAVIVRRHDIQPSSNKFGFALLAFAVLTMWGASALLKRATNTELDDVFLEYFHKDEFLRVQQAEERRQQKKAERVARKAREASPVAPKAEPTTGAQQPKVSLSTPRANVLQQAERAAGPRNRCRRLAGRRPRWSRSTKTRHRLPSSLQAKDESPVGLATGDQIVVRRRTARRTRRR